MFPFSRKRRKRQQKPTPSWVMWIVVAFIAYTVLTNNKNPQTPAISNDAKIPTAAPDAGEDTAKQSKTVIAGVEIDADKVPNLNVLKDKITPKSVMKMHVKDDSEGSGKPAICGQKATISYSSFAEDKKEIEKKQTVTFQIGENKVIPALEAGVIGMKKNGTRTIYSPDEMAYGTDNFKRDDVAADTEINFEVKMLELSPELPDLGAYHVLGDGRSLNEGYACGSQVKLHVVLWDVEGKKLYSSRDNNGSPLSFTIGKSEVFLGLEQGVLDMTAGMRRNLIVPPYFQKTLLGNSPTINFPLPKNQTILVDVESVP